MNLIIGGTHGLGLEIAKIYQQKGEDAFVTGRSYDKTQHGQGMVVDLAKQSDVNALAERLAQQELRRFFWVAGYGYMGDFAKQQDPQKMAAVNFANVLPIAQLVWRQMVENEEPTNFVVISSTTGVRSRKDEAVYAATKHAQVGFARSLGAESERLKSKVRVALFLPGGMKTPFWEGSEPDIFDEFLDPAKVAKKITDGIATQKDSFYEETIERGSL